MHMQSTMKKALVLVIVIGLFCVGCRTQLYTRKYQIIDPAVMYSEGVVREFGDARGMARQWAAPDLEKELVYFVMFNGGPWPKRAGVCFDTNLQFIYVWNTKTNLDMFEGRIAPLSGNFLKRVGERRGGLSGW